MDLDLKIQGAEVSHFEIKRHNTSEIEIDNEAPREVGHYEWVCYRDGTSISSGEVSHYVDMGAEFLAYLVLQDFWEDQISRLMAEMKLTRHQAEEMVRGHR
jgi:hypothetical protein